MGIRRTLLVILIASTAASFIVGSTLAHSLRKQALIDALPLFLGAFVVLIIVVTILGYRIVQNMTRRLFALEEAIALVAGGRLHTRVLHIGVRDDIDRVAMQFNLMAEQFEQRVNQLQRLVSENQKLQKEAEHAGALEERQRVSRELHDSVSQQLFALGMLAETGLRQLEAASTKEGPERFQRLFTTWGNVRDLAVHAQREMRALLLQLRPIDLQGQAFIEAADEFLHAVEIRNGLQCTFDADENTPILPMYEEHLFRILQESVSNVLKHAHASEIRVRYEVTAHKVDLRISDDGQGMGEDAEKTDSYGLKSMQERALRLGGRMEIWPRKPQGTMIQVLIPRTEEG